MKLHTMSGGTFDYKQHHIKEIIEEIEERMTDPYPDNVKLVLSEGVNALKRAYIFAKRIDWFLAGDDGEKDFYRKLFIEIAELEEGRE
jgi:hypothetical protein